MEKNNRIVILLGSCAVGKDTIAKLLNKEGYEYVISTTTRPIRDGESERNPYNFTDNKTFEELIKNDELIEYREYKASSGDIWYYGVENKEIDRTKNYVAVLDPVGLDGFKEYSPDSVISFFLEASEEVRKERCKIRGDYEEKEWGYRLESDNNMFTDDFIENNIDYVIDAERTTKDISNEILDKIYKFRIDKMLFIVKEKVIFMKYFMVISL
jgi:guanylate kinase